ncbi:MAG: TonB-dependent receptor, partial [Gemmatimonadetes bacterium]|nr:TonB-dependent receptor [Gemmatimonadota bacterium]NIR79314.1 TonB-dependent receptor [Gemmatimonadota bacterium]NIT87970.1 TonB-dependent receptor [Gemmatimonadota bacterium]NIU31821.1 TonB-dependent receptor [Gemmatimonadota bacterium]NIU36440.1 TonB-dependent receptor [Gemmatimonadota bacterium]
MSVPYPDRAPRIVATLPARGPAAILAVSLVLGLGAVAGAATAQEAARPSGVEADRGETALISGEVQGTMAGRRVPLAHAWISIDRAGEGSGAAVSDSAGRYEIPGVPPGVRRIRVERIGYRPHYVEVVVPSGGRLVVDLELEGDPVLVKGLTVRASRVRPVEGSEQAGETDLVDVALRALELAPGGPESGFAAARALADGEPGGDASLLVRGGDPDPKQVLLDGIPIHTPFHLGGLVEAMDPSLLGEVDDYAGAAPTPVLGGLSRVTSLTTRAPSSERLAGRVAVDAVSAGGRLEGPLGAGVSALLSGRGLHGGGARILDGSSLPYGYGEAILRIDAAPGDDHRLAMTGFWNRESTRLDFPTLSPSGRTLDTERAGEEAHWGNGALSLRYEGGSGPFDLGAAVAASRYDAALPLGRDRPAWARGRTDRLRMGVEAGRSVGPWSVGFGIVAEEIRHTSSARLLVEDEPRAVEQSSEGTVVGAHLDARRALAPDVTVRVGLRADHFSPSEGLHLSPRASLSWLLSETAVLRLAAGRHFNFVQPAELEAQVVLDDPGATRAGQALFPVAGASHLVLGLDQALTPEVSLGMEGYVKGFEGLPDAQGDRLRASGVDL